MSTDRPRHVRDLPAWLEAERAGRLDEADEALGALFRATAVPLAPPAGFADAVVGLAMQSQRPAAAWSGVPARLFIAASMVLMALPIALLAGVSLFDVIAGPGPRLASALARLLALAGGAASAAGAAWSVASTVGEAVLAACSTRQAQLVLFLNILLAFAGCAGLRRLLAPAKECW